MLTDADLLWGKCDSAKKSGQCFQPIPLTSVVVASTVLFPLIPILSLASYFPEVVRNSLECALAIAHVICAKPARWFGELCVEVLECLHVVV